MTHLVEAHNAGMEAGIVAPQIPATDTVIVPVLGEEPLEDTLDIIATIHNVVATAAFDQPLNLAEIAWRHAGELDPDSFAAVKLRLQSPRSTGLMFATGKMVVTGCSSELTSKLAIDAYYRIVLTVHPTARLKDVTIENMVFSGTLCAPVDLPKLASAHTTDTIVCGCWGGSYHWLHS